MGRESEHNRFLPAVGPEGLTLRRYEMATSATGRLLAVLGMALMAAAFAGCGGGDPDALEAASISTGRWGHTATLLEDGRVLVVGGQESPSGKLATAEIYDPAADAWSSAGSMSVARGVGHRATRLSDGRVLVTGDSDEALAEIYDPSNGQWSQAGVMIEPRNAATSTLMADGRVMVTGGGDATKAGQDPLASTEIFDPATGEWTATGDLLNENYAHGAVLLQGWQNSRSRWRTFRKSTMPTRARGRLPVNHSVSARAAIR